MYIFIILIIIIKLKKYNYNLVIKEYMFEQSQIYRLS